MSQKSFFDFKKARPG